MNKNHAALYALLFALTTLWGSHSHGIPGWWIEAGKATIRPPQPAPSPVDCLWLPWLIDDPERDALLIYLAGIFLARQRAQQTADGAFEQYNAQRRARQWRARDLATLASAHPLLPPRGLFAEGQSAVDNAPPAGWLTQEDAQQRGFAVSTLTGNPQATTGPARPLAPREVIRFSDTYPLLEAHLVAQSALSPMHASSQAPSPITDHSRGATNRVNWQPADEFEGNPDLPLDPAEVHALLDQQSEYNTER